MQQQSRVSLIVGAVVLLGLTVLFAVSQARGTSGADPRVETPEQRSAVVRDDSRVLGEKGSSGVTFVEFLDFECEACGAAFPVVEDLRRKYAGKVTFVIRYFPLPGHFNAERAARAVESAARQGKLEEMYSRMYETQKSWGEARTPHDDTFRGFAEDIGLDMEQYDADYASEEVAARVARDVEDGTTLGLQGTPSFFVDGQPFQPKTVEDIASALDEALAG